MQPFQFSIFSFLEKDQFLVSLFLILDFTSQNKKLLLIVDSGAGKEKRSSKCRLLNETSVTLILN